MSPETDVPYPDKPGARDSWVLAQRGGRRAADPYRPYGVFVEEEAADGAGRPVRALTVLLSSSECPWRCLMCDLWQHTLPEAMPAGAVPAQVSHALEQEAARGPAGLPPVIKLYNSGSFFDPRAVPPDDYPAIARALRPFRRVIVECHPKLVGPRVDRFQAELRRAGGSPPQLEVAMGLETAEPNVLAKLNKRMTLEDFARAAKFLREHRVDLRAFVLLQPPFLPARESVTWAVRSAAFAFAQGAGAVSIIPTRTGNGALDALGRAGDFTEPDCGQLEAALSGALALGGGRVFADLWDLERFSRCPDCFESRKRRLEAMNRAQRPQPPVACPRCGGSRSSPHLGAQNVASEAGPRSSTSS